MIDKEFVKEAGRIIERAAEEAADRAQPQWADAHRLAVRAQLTNLVDSRMLTARQWVEWAERPSRRFPEHARAVSASIFSDAANATLATLRRKAGLT